MQNNRRDVATATRINQALVAELCHAWHGFGRKISPLLAKHNLTLTQFTVLELLYEKGPQKISAILSETQATAGNITVVIKNLTKLKLTHKLVAPGDKRIHVIDLTQSGRAFMQKFLPIYGKSVDAILMGLNNSQKQQLITLAQKLKGGMEKVDNSTN